MSKNTLSFRTAGIAAVWLCEIRGQFSDGTYENNSAWENPEMKDILWGFMDADVEVAGENWKAGLDMGDGYCESSPFSGRACLKSVLRYLKDEWAWRVVAQYAIGEKYGIEVVKQLEENHFMEYLTNRMLSKVWKCEKFCYKNIRKEMASINKIIDVKEVTEYFSTLDRYEVLDKLLKNADELDEVLKY